MAASTAPGFWMGRQRQRLRAAQAQEGCKLSSINLARLASRGSTSRQGRGLRPSPQPQLKPGQVQPGLLSLALYREGDRASPSQGRRSPACQETDGHRVSAPGPHVTIPCLQKRLAKAILPSFIRKSTHPPFIKHPLCARLYAGQWECSSDQDGVPARRKLAVQ